MPSTTTTTAQPTAHHAANGTTPGGDADTENGVSDHHLPSSSAPHLALARPTAAERARILRLNGASWRGALPLDAYARREAHLAAQDLTRGGGWAAWVLVEGEDLWNGTYGGKEGGEEGRRRVLASCETYRKRAIVADGRSGIVRDVWAQGVGSVYCPVEMRGRGYAGRLMRELALAGGHHAFDDGPCEASVLFSDIGKVTTPPSQVPLRS